MPRIKIGLVLLGALVIFVLVLARTNGLNGPAYWKWEYRNPPLPPVRTYLPMLLAAIPALAVQFLTLQKRPHRIIALLALMLSCYGLKLASVLPRTSPPSLLGAVAVVESPRTTSYYTDAISVKDMPLRQWISQYPRLMEQFHLHTQSKPPGPVLYWWTMIRIFGEQHNAASRAGGLLLGALATLSIPAAYLLLKLMLGSAPAAFVGASFMALSPGFVLFFPMLDPVYVLLSSAMLGSWYVALRDNRVAGSIGLGAALAATVFISFNTLVLGAFMIGLVFVVPPVRSLKERLRIAARQSGIALASAAAILLIGWLVIGYDPIATFRSAWRLQQALLELHADQRPYPATVLFDMTDFALGTGWISVALVICCFLAPSIEPGHRALAMLALGQLVVTALTGLLPGETARVWCFMLPLVMIPVGLELSRWPSPARIACLSALVLLIAAIHQNMQFLY